MTCREEILVAIREITGGSPSREFSVKEVVVHMQRKKSRYAESTIRTHITSKLCANAPDHHETTYDDLIRVGHGIYRLR